MKIASTPPQRFRQRIDFEGEAAFAVDMNGAIRIKGFGVDRHYTIELAADDIEALVCALQRRERMVRK